MSKPNQLAVKGPADYTLTVTVTPEALVVRQGLLETASMIVAVSGTDDQKVATQATAELKRWSKSVEETRVELTKPLLEGQRAIMAAAKNAVIEVDAEAKRIESLLADFHRQQEQERLRAQQEQARKEREAEQARLAEERRLAEIERLRLEALAKAESAKTKKAREAAAEEAARLQAQQDEAHFAADFAPAPVYVPAPEIVKPSGASVKKTVKFEVTDLQAFFKAHPELCEITVKTQAVNYFINTPDQDITNIPGLHCWEDTKVAVSTR